MKVSYYFVCELILVQLALFERIPAGIASCSPTHTFCIISAPQLTGSAACQCDHFNSHHPLKFRTLRPLTWHIPCVPLISYSARRQIRWPLPFQLLPLLLSRSVDPAQMSPWRTRLMPPLRRWRRRSRPPWWFHHQSVALLISSSTMVSGPCRSPLIFIAVELGSRRFTSPLLSVSTKFWSTLFSLCQAKRQGGPKIKGDLFW